VSSSSVSLCGAKAAVYTCRAPMPRRWHSLPYAALLVGCTAQAFASDGALHADPVASVVLALAVILGAAKLGGDLAMRLGQPSVLGELLFGVLLGNLPLAGVTAFEAIKHDASVDMLARLGVIVLLFEVGLESTVAQMLKVGWSSLLVATVGVVTPFALGWGVSAMLLPEASEYVHAFLGAALTATSVGITARVLKDLERADSDEARIILGAAVIDDVMGLIVLAVVTGIIAAADQGGELSSLSIGLMLLKALLFLVGSLFLGLRISPRMFALASKLKARGVLLAVGLSFCFLLSWLASAIGLAPIVGAFAAGLILEQVHYRDFTTRGEHPLEELIRPISAFLVPIFFVTMGMHTDLRVFADASVLGLSAALIVAAIIGKQACYFGVLGKGVDRLTVAIGMVPRGEVGLIFANIGLSLKIGGERIIDAGTYSAVVAMVIATTLITPPALRWSLRRNAALVRS
jgi:Kef-type K+ transport system membrane component KefB